ncbi:hypothetical protein U9M48_010616 [Paspalum notatum var. saurae]|uniref:Uncharacterized protein n=1 Tax=Paspalum notatum var. saurae TaxID=547442 RepID=A0AAQ3STL7_PASNO
MDWRQAETAAVERKGTGRRASRCVVPCPPASKGARRSACSSGGVLRACGRHPEPHADAGGRAREGVRQQRAARFTNLSRS